MGFQKYNTRLKRIAVVIALIGFVTVLCVPPLLAWLAAKQLERVFPGSSVSVGSAVFSRPFSLAFSRIRIRRHPFYDFDIGEACASFGKISASQVRIKIDMGDKGIRDFAAFLKAPRGKGMPVWALEVSGLSLDIASSDLTLKAKASFALSSRSWRLERIGMTVGLFRFGGLEVRNASLSVEPEYGYGSFFVGEARRDKLALTNARSQAKLEGAHLRFERLSADFLDGKINGTAEVRASAQPRYFADLKFSGLDSAALVRGLKLEEKIELQGRLNGSFLIEGESARILALKGDFDSERAGGTLTIKDAGYLEYLARTSNQPMDILMESFNNYRYNTALVKLSLDKGDLKLDLALKGEAGSRTLHVVLHDFQLQKEER